MRLGFSGTRRGCTEVQRLAMRHAVLRLLDEVPAAIGQFELASHGGCVGADAEFHRVVLPVAARVAVRPASDVAAHLVAFQDASPKTIVEAEVVRVYPSTPALVRNHVIVDNCDVLLACPQGLESSCQRSGTWATVRYARSKGKRRVIVYPNGTVCVGERHALEVVLLAA